jgi:mono/diheme cytochrome c family protein
MAATEEAWLMRNLFLLISAMILFSFTTTAALRSMAQENAPEPASATARKPVKSTPESQAHAKKLYTTDCAMCHGDYGDGKTDMAKGMELNLPDWTKPESLAGKPDEVLFKAIRNGKGKMPAEDAQRADDDVVWNLIAFIRNMPKMSKDQPAATPASPAN